MILWNIKGTWHETLIEHLVLLPQKSMGSDCLVLLPLPSKRPTLCLQPGQLLNANTLPLQHQQSKLQSEITLIKGEA